MTAKRIFKFLYFTTITFYLLVSCDKDYNEIGINIIGDDHFGFEKDDSKSVIAFSQATGVVQSNNLLINSLGIFNNPIFGKTKATFVTQLQMAVPNFQFDSTLSPTGTVVLDSVSLSIPYFSKRTAVSTIGVGTYVLDSISGNAAMNLKVFQSGFYLNDFEAPSLNTAPKYYTDNTSIFKTGIILNDDADPKQNVAFEPNSKEYIVLKRENTLEFSVPKVAETRQTPRMILNLNKAKFQQLIVNAPAGKLANNNTFKEYFRGLYFEVDDAAEGRLLKLDFSKGSITLYYKEYSGLKENPANPTGPKIPITFDHDSNTSTPEIPRLILKSYVLNMIGNTVNIMRQTNSSNYGAKIANGTPNPTTGDSRLYVKGGAEGSVALIDLFGKDLYGEDGLTGTPNKVADELDIMRKNSWLINEANIVFTIDNNAMGTLVQEPERVYLFDATNKQPLIDYYKDVISNASSPKNIKPVYGGILKRKTIANSGRGIEYKFRITNHIKNLVKFKDSTNVRLGLSVTEFVGNIANAKMKTGVNVPFPVDNTANKIFDKVPAASVMNNLGTILYGNNIPFGSIDGDYGKRIKLEIYYTKPKN
jgi:hypothetical protein